MSKHKRLALAFLLHPPPNGSPVTRSHFPSHPLLTRFQRYMKAMCGSGWLCELGARPHLRSCAEGADCTVTSFSPLPVLYLLFAFSFLISWDVRVDRWLTCRSMAKRRNMSSCMHYKRSLLLHIHFKLIPIHVFCWLATVLHSVWVGHIMGKRVMMARRQF